MVVTCVDDKEEEILQVEFPHTVVDPVDQGRESSNRHISTATIGEGGLTRDSGGPSVSHIYHTSCKHRLIAATFQGCNYSEK